MTKLSDLGPPIPGKLYGPEPADEALHFYSCSYCGQAVDQRDFRQVFWHQGPGHEPLEPDSADIDLEFRKPK